MVAGKRVGVVGVVLALGAALLGPTGAVAAPAEEGFGKDAWWYKAMGLAEAHKETTGKGVKIAVIDSPVDLSVPELRGQNVTPVVNVCGGKATAKGSAAEHGTTVAVNIVGSGTGTNPGSLGVIGIAPDAELLTFGLGQAVGTKLRCVSKQESIAAAEAIDMAVERGVRIISLSFGSATGSPAEKTAVTKALEAGVVIVAASGDRRDSSVLYPAAYPGVIAVAAVDRDAKPWVGNVASGREKFVISAPGVELATGSFDGERWRSSALVTGTSEAAPIVAGGLALVAAKYPKATGNQLIQHLIRNPGGDGGFGKDLQYGYGIISVTKMLAADPTEQPDVNPLIEAAEPAPASTTAPEATADQTSNNDLTEPVAAADADAGGGGGSSGALIGAGVVALLVIGGGAFLLMRRRPTPSGGGRG
ncbi:MAG: S8 family serine peptidase [Sporichthyaceae bacterium]